MKEYRVKDGQGTRPMLEPYSDPEMAKMFTAVTEGYYAKVVTDSRRTPELVGQMVERLVATALAEHEEVLRLHTKANEARLRIDSLERQVGARRMELRMALEQCEDLRGEIHMALSGTHPIQTKAPSSYALEFLNCDGSGRVPVSGRGEDGFDRCEGCAACLPSEAPEQTQG